MSIFGVNQVVFVKHKLENSEKFEWYPAVVIDIDDGTWPRDDLEPKKDGYNHILWLGSGKVAHVPLSNIRDFCEGFKECMQKDMCTDSKYILAISLAVKLAAVRAGHPNPEKQWMAWAFKNIGQHSPLTVTKAFYNAVIPQDGKKPSPSRTTSRPPIHSERAPLNLNAGQLVWAKVGFSESFWPAVVLDKQFWIGPEKVGVVVLTKEARRFNVEESNVSDFCETFHSKFFESKTAEDKDYQRAVKLAVNDIRETVTGRKKEEWETLGDTSAVEWIMWAKKSLPTHKQIVASDGIREFLGKGKIGPRDEAKSSSAITMDCSTSYNSEDPEDPKPSDMAEAKIKRRVALKSMPKKKKHSTPSWKETDKGELDWKTLKSAFLSGEPNHNTPEKKTVSMKKKSVSLVSPGSGDSHSFADGKNIKKTPKRRRTVDDEETLKIPLDQGWVRIMIYRKMTADGSEPKKRGDVYYQPPDGSKRLRSNPDVEKYLSQRGVTALLPGAHFSFKDSTILDHPNQIIQ